MFKDLTCRLGLHWYKHVYGYHNRYYECRHCSKRTVRIGNGGYQPIDNIWLNGGDKDSVTLKDPPKKC
jgi:hypothetical protein